MSLKSPLNVFEIVSVSTKVPDTNATPSITAMPVSRKRTFLLQIPLSVTFHMRSGAQALHLVEDRVGGRLVQLVDDGAVGEEHDAVGVARGVRVVRDHHDRLPEIVDRLAHEREDLSPRPRVEVAGGLVGEDDRGLAEQRASDGDALLLA